jgi:hypothetical protein
MWAISRSEIAQKVFMAALSKQSPVDPNERCRPAWPAVMTKSSEVYRAAVVAVMDQPIVVGGGAPERRRQRVDFEPRVWVFVDRPADDAAMADPDIAAVAPACCASRRRTPTTRAARWA